MAPNPNPFPLCTPSKTHPRCTKWRDPLHLDSGLSLLTQPAGPAAAIESFLSQAKGSYTYPAESYISQVGESYTYSAESYTSKEAGSYAYPTGTISSMDYNNTYAVSSFVTATAMPTIHGNHTRNLTVSSTTSDFPSPTAITNTGCFNSPFIAGLVSVIAIGMVAIAL